MKMILGIIIFLSAALGVSSCKHEAKEKPAMLSFIKYRDVTDSSVFFEPAGPILPAKGDSASWDTGEKAVVDSITHVIDGKRDTIAYEYSYDGTTSVEVEQNKGLLVGDKIRDEFLHYQTVKRISYTK